MDSLFRIRSIGAAGVSVKLGRGRCIKTLARGAGYKTLYG